MITNKPTETELRETADGWLILAWEQVVEMALEWSETADYIEMNELTLDPDAERRFWDVRRHQLNNTLLLCQQAMELYLKARIAAVDPLLLVVGKARVQLQTGGGNFLAVPTIKASELPQQVERICSTRLDPAHTALFEKLRIERNRIAHLHAGNFPTEARLRINDVLSAFSVNYPGGTWQSFCKAHMAQSGKNGPLAYGDDDYTHSRWLREFEAAVELLTLSEAKRHFGFDKKKPRLFCPQCWSMRPKHDSDGRDFAQERADGSIFCAGCLHVYPDRAAYITDGGEI